VIAGRRPRNLVRINAAEIRAILADLPSEEGE